MKATVVLGIGVKPSRAQVVGLQLVGSKRLRGLSLNIARFDVIASIATGAFDIANCKEALNQSVGCLGFYWGSGRRKFACDEYG